MARPSIRCLCRSNRGAAALLLVLLAVWLCRPAPVRAEGQLTNCSPLSLNDARLEARRLLDNAERTGDGRSKLGYLEAAYRIYQDPVILYNLGSWWFEARKPIEAADLLRRYLHESGSAVTDARKARIARMRARARGALSELQISGEPCAFVYVDKRLVGRLPLSLPLLLRPGRHTIDVEKDHRRNQQTLAVKSGTASVTMRLPASLVLLPEPLPQANLPGPLWERLSRAATVAATAEGVTLITERARDAIISRLPALRGCLDTIDCQEDLARQLQAQLVLLLKVEVDGGESVGALLSPKYTVRLLDTSVGGISLSRTTGCTACNPDEAADRLSGVVREVLQRGLQQERSTLEITSVPEAVVTVDGRRVGRTPFLREVLSGAHEITLTAIGYNPHRAKLVAQEHRKATLSVNLSVASTLGPNLPVPPAAPVYELRESRGPRPLWRKVGGGVAGLVGIGLVALGASALSIDGQCGPGPGAPVTPPCNMPGQGVYQTAAAGGAMLGTGLVFIIGGAAVALWPGERRLVRAPLTAPPTTALAGTLPLVPGAAELAGAR